MFAAIAFIQQDNVIRAYKDSFIGWHNCIGRLRPFFPIRLYNQSERTKNGISRTNNKVEAWHNAFARLVGGNHPNILKFLASLQSLLSLAMPKLILIYPYNPIKN
ncbi:hypothetical protein HZS_4354 [Henneguya salminicola]|nr:hypothetical protein HZS_4354 [Henneguya salminicola]